MNRPRYTKCESGCWLWNGPVSGGYGCVGVGDGSYAAHRLMYLLHVGNIPRGLHVLHRCDTPACVNPAHLFLGTNLLNMQDRNAKGRVAKGEQNGRAKLTMKDVHAIRTDFRPLLVIANEYGVTRQQAGKIRRGLAWSAV